VLPWFTIQRRHIQRAVRHLVKLFGVGPLGALDDAKQVRGARRQNEQAPAELLAGLLESSNEFAAAIDLDGSDGERNPLRKAVDELWAVAAVARVCACRTCVREMTSRAAKFFQITPGSGRTSSGSIGSTGTRSPGWRARCTLGFLTA